MGEKRRWIRIKPHGLVPRTGKIVLGDKTIDCRIIDLSAGGACVELSSLYELPKRFEFLHGHSRTVCRAAWVRGFRIGLIYETTKQKAMIAGGLSRTTSGLSRLSRDRYRDAR